MILLQLLPLTIRTIRKKYQPSPSPETRAKVSAALKGRKLTPEHVAKVAAANRGKPKRMPPFTPEHRANLAAAMKGRVITATQREKLRVANLGKKQSAETIKKRVNSLIGRVVSEATREQLSYSNKISHSTLESRLLNSSINMGKVHTSLKTKKGPTNHKSIKGAIRDPQGVVWTICNLLHFVREHEDLFDPNDVVWKPRIVKSLVPGVPDYQRGWRCAAYGGLSTLFARGKKTPGSWKGWTVVADTEPLADLLQRQSGQSFNR